MLDITTFSRGSANRGIAKVWALAITLACTCAGALAQGFPSKPVRLIVGFAAGGPTDVVARAFAEHATRMLGQTFIVENKPGANSVLAAEAVAGASADGHVVLLGATNHTMIPALYGARVKFDAARSFIPVCTLAESPTLLVTGPSMKVTSLPGFVQDLQSSPGRRTYGSPGAGSSGHFAGERFARLTGTAMNHIPYKGAAPMVTDLIGGQLDSSFATLGSVLPHIQAGKLTPLAIAASQRSALLPNTPTFDEAGLRNFRDSAWYGLLVPAGTPTMAVETLEKTARSFSQAPASVEKLRGLGLSSQNVCGPAFAAQIQREIQSNSQLAKELDLKVE